MRWCLPLLLALPLACSHAHLPPADEQRLDSPDEAANYFAAKRGITADFDLNARYTAARAHIERMGRVSAESLGTTLPGSWRFLGPGNIGGRTRALLIDPGNPSVLYAGAVSGGVWKSVDGGGSWTAVTDWLPNLAVNSLAFDPTDSRVIYAGTGEGYFREDIRGTALPIRGNGIFVTRDAGVTWEQLASTTGEDFYWVNHIVVSAHDPARLYAGTRNGVFRSRDRGATWSRVVATTVKGGCLDLALRPNTPGDTIFASCGLLAQATVYRSTSAESDAEWTAVLSEPGMSRTSLAIAPSNPSTVYALAAGNGGTFDQGLLAVFRSTQNGDPGTWTAQVRTTNAPASFGPLLLTNVSSVVNENCNPIAASSRISNMGWHCNVIAVDPLDENRLWAAGVDLFRSDDGGRNWGLASYWWTDPVQSSFVHADQHAIVFDPRYDGAGNQTMLVTNDGGVYRTDNARAAVGMNLTDYCFPSRSSVVFRSLNHDFGATQFYNGAVFPDGHHYLGGAQDNATPMGSDMSGVNGWVQLFAGDGGYVAVDPIDPNIVYAEAQNLILFLSKDGGRSYTDTFANDTFLFISPFILDPNERQRIWAGGGFFLWRRDAQTGGFRKAGAALPAQISSLAVPPGNSNRIVLGTTTGGIFRSSQILGASTSTAWESAKPRDGWVSSITFDPLNDMTVYATYAGFGGTHVWKSVDGAATWTPLDGSGDATLPDIPAHSIAIDAARLYLGTDLGIFVSTDGGAHWLSDTGFPHVITESIVLQGGSLYAFTHGRGAWRFEPGSTRRRRAAGR